MVAPFRLSLCNEVFEKQSFDRVANCVSELGYDGLEIAPYTLAESPELITALQRAEYRRILSGTGLGFVGLHWLMVSPPGLHVTTPDSSLRVRSWQHIRHLIDLCADLGDGGVMVFGSPKQRSTVAGVTPIKGRRIFTDELAKVAPQAEERGVRILVEALPSDQSNVINTLEEAVAVVEAIHSPAVETMFDTHNAVDEKLPHPEVIRKYFQHIAHIHVNEIDGREPGCGDYDFGALFATLRQLKYEGWVSVEAFDFSRDPKEIAGGAIRHLRRAMKEASPNTAGVAR
jgi:D-psicose/D-tagatose/L-ribulose 3-epimerase